MKVSVSTSEAYEGRTSRSVENARNWKEMSPVALLQYLIQIQCGNRGIKWNFIRHKLQTKLKLNYVEWKD
jgi:hypothetical protein